MSLSLSQPIPTQPGLLMPDLITNNTTSNSDRNGGSKKDNGQLDTPLVTSASVDGRANNGLGNPQEMQLLYYVTPACYIDVNGIGGIEIQSLQIGTFAANVRLSNGRFALLVFHEYGELRKGTSIHSKLQLSDGGCKVHDDPISLGSWQCIIHEEGIHIPMGFCCGLAFIEMLYPSDEDIETLPCFAMTRNALWDPTKYNKVRSRPMITAHTNTIQPNPTNGEHISQRIDQFGEPLHQLRINDKHR